MKTRSNRLFKNAIVAVFVCAVPVGETLADETCNSPYTSR
jgi:hypothetical protein